MTRGVKLSIALAITVPLLIVGSSMAFAAGDGPTAEVRDSSTVSSYAAPPVSTVIDSGDNDVCPGLCQGNGPVLCEGGCDADCGGACDRECGGACLGPNSCDGQCLGSNVCGSGCDNAVAQPAGSARLGSGCGRRLRALQTSTAACTSCDVVGLNFDNPVLFSRPATNA